MASAFDVELPFPIRKSRRSRLSVGDVKVYSDIALTKGHAGKGLHGARDAFGMGAVEAGKLADIMRQVDVSGTGSLRRHDFFLALDRAGVSLPMEDTDNLFRSLASANRGRGCDIEMFAHLVNFWVRNNGDKTPIPLLAAGGHDLLSERIPPHLSQTDHASPIFKAPGSDSFDAASRTSHAVGSRDSAAGEEEISDGGRRGNGAGEGTTANPPNGRFNPDLDGRNGGRCATPEAEGGAAIAGRRNSFAVTMTDIFNYAPARDRRTYAPRHDRADAPEPAPAAGHSVRTPTELVREHGQGGASDARDDARDDSRSDCRGNSGGDAWGNARGDARSSAARALVLDADVAREGEAKAPDEAYMHSLGYGNLGSLLPILLDRRAALEVSLERLDRGGTGRVRPGDFMAAVRQVGIALSVVQEGNMMDLLERMGALTSGEDGSDWVDSRAGVAAVALAGEKAGGRSFRVQEKPRSFLEEGTRLLDAASDHYANVHLSLLPSSILLGPNALRERRSAADDGAGNVFVTAGSLRKALRHAGVLLGDADDRVLWRLLLRRAQVVHGRGKADGKEHASGEDTSRFLERGIIPLPLLDDVMGFNADEALRTRRQLQQQEAHPATSVSAPYRDHLGPWAAPVAQSKVPGGGGDIDDAPLLLQKARLRVKGLGDTVAERSQVLMTCLPKLGPTGERQALPRRELTRLLQELRVGVRSGELQKLWYHMDRNKVSRERFRGILLEATDSLHVTFPAPPCPYPAGPVTPTSNVSYSGDSTPVGGVSVSGARLQRVLNQAAYEENMRKAAGSALTYGVPEMKESEQALASSPPRSSSKDTLPVLLERAVKRVRELDGGQEAVFALVPDMGRAKEGMRITRGGVQRVLHGLGVVPRSGELQQLWWSLEKGVVGDPRITVEGFRDVLLGRVTRLVLLPDWTAQGDAGRGNHEEQRSSTNTLEGGDGGCESPGTRVLREVRTALGLVRRRVRGIIRGCEDRDLTADGWVTEEAFLAVLRDQGILQQLGNVGLSALRRAIGLDVGRDKRSAPTAVVRYTGLVGAIDNYLDTLISWDTADVAVRLGSGKQAHEDDRGVVIQTSPTPHSSGNPNRGLGDRAAPSPPAETPLGPLSSKKMVDVKVSQNSMARAARGWDDDPPVAPLGMRHFPQKNCSMATLVGGRVVSDRAATDNKTEHERERKPFAGGVGVSTGMTGALHWRDTAPAPPASSANPASPRRSPSAAPGMSPSPAWRRGNDKSAPDCSPIPTQRQQSGSGHKSGSAGRNHFVPAGGTSGLGRPSWSSGRRGSEGGVGGLAGGGVSRAICWEGGPESESRQESQAASPAAVRGDSGDRCNSPGKRSNDDYRDGSGTTPEVAGGEASHIKVPLSARHRGQSSTGDMREVTEAWPESADHRTDGANDGMGATLHRSVYQPGVGKNPRDVSESRKKAAKALLSDRALLAGVFRQLAGVGGPQARDGLDRAGMMQLLRYPRLPSRISEEEAEDLADAVLIHCGSSAVRFSSLTTFLANTAGSCDAPASPPSERVPAECGSRDHAWDVAASRPTRNLGEDPIAQSIKLNIQHGRSELRLAGEDAESRLSCAVHLRRAFRKRRKNLGGDPGGVDDCSVGASDLPGVLQDMGVMLNPTEAAFLIKKCRVQSIPGRRPATGGFDEAPVRAGDVLGFFTELLAAH